MNRYSGLKSWMTTPVGAASAFICALTGLMLGLQAWWTFAQPLPPTFYGDFSGAHWIQADPKAMSGYFRKKFYVTEQVNQAWLTLAATDYFEVSINGVPIISPQISQKIYPAMSGSFIAADQEAQFDLTPYIVQGENTIAVYVRRRMMDSQTDLLAKGFVSEVDHSQWLFSDASWKAKMVPDDIVGRPTWSMPYQLDDAWPAAHVLARTVPGNRVQPLAIPPAIFENPVKGKWIGTQDSAEKQCYFRRDFSVWGTKDTWLELSTQSDFEVYLNDHLITNSQLVAEFKGSTGSGQQPLSLGGPINNALLVNLGPWLSWGTNRLEVRLQNGLEENAFMAEILSEEPDGTVRNIPTDGTWLSHGAMGTSNWAPAREMADYGAPPYGEVSKVSYPPPINSGEIGRQIFNGVVLTIFVFGFWVFAWIIFSRMLADKLDVMYSKALILDALGQVPLILGMIMLFVASCDIRIRPDSPYDPIFVWMLMLLSLLLRGSLWLWRPAVRPIESAPDRFVATRAFLRNYGFGLAMLGIVVFAFFIRLHDLMQFGLDQDEVFMRNIVHGILERGFPSVEINGLLYRLTTYELVPYPQFICAVLTGFQDWSFRVPGLLFGTATCALLGIYGSQLFDRRVGLLTAAIYACVSWNIHWARHCFHLQQAQFMSLNCFYVFYLSIRHGGGVDRRYFPLACILFCCTYLTWEGSGFILPAFAAALVALHPTDWRWLKQFHFWAGLCFVGAVVLSQLCDRAITLPTYLGLGSGLSDISSPALCFLDSHSDVLFYTEHFLWSEALSLPLVLCALGVFLFWSHRPTRYVLTIYFSLLFCYSCLLPIYSVRYGYFYEAMLVLGGCAVAVQIYDRITALSRSVDGPWVGTWARVSVAAFIVMLFMLGSETGLKVYRLTYNTQNPDFFTRQADGYIDYLPPANFVAANYRPGDTVLGASPHTFTHFTGKFAYGLNPLLLKRMYYVQGMNPPSFVDRYSGTFSIRNLPELLDVYRTHRRVWVMSSPDLAMNEGTDRATNAFLVGTSRLVYEDNFSRVYLWDGGSDASQMPIAAPGVLAGNQGAVLNPQNGSPTPVNTSGPLPVGTAPMGSTASLEDVNSLMVVTGGAPAPDAATALVPAATPATPNQGRAALMMTSSAPTNIPIGNSSTPANLMTTTLQPRLNGLAANGPKTAPRTLPVGGGGGGAALLRLRQGTVTGGSFNGGGVPAGGVEGVGAAGPQPNVIPEMTANPYRNVIAP